jgi:hypothetical protein
VDFGQCFCGWPRTLILLHLCTLGFYHYFCDWLLTVLLLLLLLRTLVFASVGDFGLCFCFCCGRWTLVFASAFDWELCFCFCCGVWTLVFTSTVSWQVGSSNNIFYTEQ